MKIGIQMKRKCKRNHKLKKNVKTNKSMGNLNETERSYC